LSCLWTYNDISPFCIVVIADIIMNVYIFVIAPWGTLIGIQILILIFWKFWKRNDLYENLKKGGIVEKRGEEETKSMPQVPVVRSFVNISIKQKKAS
jgi:hypothetical protein